MAKNRKRLSVVRGTITVDSSRIITACDFAVAAMLHIDRVSVLGKPYQDVFRTLSQLGLLEALDTLYRQNTPDTISYLVDCDIPDRGHVVLSFFLVSRYATQGNGIEAIVAIDERTPE